MDNSKVIPIKKNLFPDRVRDNLGESMERYLKSPQNDKEKVVDEIEQVFCTSIVVAAKSVGANLANKLLNKLFGPEKSEDACPEPCCSDTKEDPEEEDKAPKTPETPEPVGP